MRWNIRLLKSPAVMLAWVLWCSGCLFDPEYGVRDCELRCEDRCPSGFVCRDGFCVEPGSAISCTESLRIVGNTDWVHYACEPLSIELRARGGNGALDWSVEPLPEGVDAEADGTHLRLSAEPDHALSGDYASIEVSVRDAFGGEVSELLELQVRECTRAATPREHVVCAGEPLAIPLLAEGGFGRYEWSASDGSLPRGFTIDDGLLVGAPTESDVGEITVTIQVSDWESEAANAESTRRFVDEQELRLEVKDCLRSQLPESLMWCAGDTHELELRADGGSGAHHWEVNTLPAWLDFDPVSGTLSGVPEILGSVPITLVVSDDTGDSEEHVLVLEVEQCPEIQNQRITACVGRPLEETLVAEPRYGRLSWSKLGGPDWLKVDAERGLLHGEPDAPESSELWLRVTDDAGGEREGRLPVTVYAADTQSCIEPLRVATDELPDACAGQPYRFTLQASGGAGNYFWTPQSPWPSGSWLTLSEDGLLQGTPPIAAAFSQELAVMVLSSQSTEQPVQRAFTLRVRPQCKFAYIGRTALESDRLFVGDVRQRLQPALTPEEPTNDLPGSVDAVRFEFSPDGRQIAYVVRPRNSEPDRLFVAPVTQLGDEPPKQQLPVIDGLERVATLSWSPDAQQLAVLFHAGEQLRVTSYALGESEARRTPDRVVTANPNTRLYWLGQTLCFRGTMLSPGGEWGTLVCHSSGPDGLSAASSFRHQWNEETLSNEYEFQLHIEARLDGLFLFSQAAPDRPFQVQHIYDDGVRWGSLAHYPAIPDPSFRWWAQPGDALAIPPNVGIFPISPDVETYGDIYVSAHEVTDCSLVAAWDHAGQALACLSDDGLRIARLDDTGAVVAERTVPGTEDFAATANRKVFSRQAEWFVYQGSDRLVAVDLRTDSWTSDTLASSNPNEPIDLVPLRPGQLLLHSGSTLELLSLPAGDRHLLGSDLASPFPCLSNHAMSGPLTWCGGRSIPATFALAEWGGLVFTDRSGQVWSVDLNAADLTDTSDASALVNEAVTRCGNDGCANELRLAP